MVEKLPILTCPSIPMQFEDMMIEYYLVLKLPVLSSCKHTILTFFSLTAHPESDHHPAYIASSGHIIIHCGGYPQNHCLANQHTPKQWMNTHNRNIGHQIIACIMTWWPKMQDKGTQSQSSWTGRSKPARYSRMSWKRASSKTFSLASLTFTHGKQCK